jgi:excisionase family DNA binding protein
MQATGIETLMTAQQVAEVFAVKTSTIYDAAYRGVLPTVRLWEGRRRSLLRFRRSDIEKLIRERVAIGGPDAPDRGTAA